MASFQADYLNSKKSTISIGTQKKWLDLKPIDVNLFSVLTLMLLQ